MRSRLGLPFAVAAVLTPLPAFAASEALRGAIAPEANVETPSVVTLQPLEPAPTQAPAAPSAPAIDPYDPLGIRAGGFVLYPSLTSTLGYTTNANDTPGGVASAFALVEPELLIESDWNRHAFSIDAKGAYQTYFAGGTPPDVPSASVDAQGTIDLMTGWSVDLGAGYAYSRQSPSDADYPVGAVTPPDVNDFSGSAALNGTFGRATFTVEGTVDRTAYANGRDSTGAILDQGDRTNTDYGGRLRLGYELTPTLSPFVEGTVSRRVYDRTVDTNGLRRSSVGLGGRAGVAVDTGPLLKGEASVGWEQNDYDDPALATLQTVTLDGTLAWAPTELTTVTFDGSTGLNPSTDPASSGSVDYYGAVNVDYAWRQNIVFNANGSIDFTRYQGTGREDTTWVAGLGATWKMSRLAWLVATYAHTWGTSTVAGSTYQSDTVKAALKIQR